MIRVVLADDQSLVRAGLRALLGAAPDVDVVGEADDGVTAVECIRRHAPDLVLMDIRMPGCDGLEATRVIVEDPALSATKVVILTTFAEDDYIFEALRIGASGFLVKDTEPADLVTAVRTVHAGEALLSPAVTRRLIEEYARRAAAPRVGRDMRRRLAELTDREREVVALAARGLSNHEIARELVGSPATAKTHISRSMTKLSVRDRAQLVVLGYETGLVRPGWSV